MTPAVSALTGRAGADADAPGVGETPASGALLRVFAILPAMIRLSCGLAGAAAALAVRSPPVSTPLLVGAVLLLTAWSAGYAWWTVRHGLTAWVSYVDIALTAVACLFINRLVAPEVLPGEVSWIAILASTSVVVAQFALPLGQSIPAGLLIAAAYAVGAHRAGEPAEATAHAVTLVVQTGFAAALGYLTRRSSRRADAAFADYRRSAEQAAVARAARSAERRQNRDLHDTVLSTLTVVSLGAVPAGSALLRERAGADLRTLSALADARAHADADGPGPDAPVRLDHRLRTVLAKFPQVPVTADLAPCTVAAAVADGLADSALAALSNVSLHAPGATAALRLDRVGAAVVVEVRDDGPGFDPDTVPLHRYGLRESVHGRMATLGGRAVVDSAPGRGTLVRLEWSDAG
ncbi:ATP-binding protein [Solwaraspora sp. WMMD1047]|uniref:sensor histidine kinase n=1 Tax=Solwaraspora sp. WMMD1047 TaxID=3016102 RepID=UPI00241599E3|nr:ATP-binding protein [Solwaraspora sp. WMMD1047]MDG4829031.1 ATP-binding protein [Solwaraspora sp. WMMD1047]